MFYAVKKKTAVYGFLVVLAVTILVLLAAAREATQDITTPVTGESPISGKIILVDPGHGGFDAGAADNGVSEKDINLSVALKLKGFLEEQGAKVLMTREEDKATADEKREYGVSAKTSDLRNRRKMIQSSGADVFVSVHMNKFPQPKYWGAQVFYAAEPTESKRLGESIQKALPDTLGDGNTRVAKQADKSIYILKAAPIPSVIVECGFLSNPKEAQKLQQSDYQNKVAWAISMGIYDYFRDFEKKY